MCAVSSRYDVALPATLTKLSRTTQACTLKHDATSGHGNLPRRITYYQKIKLLKAFTVWTSPASLMPRTLRPAYPETQFLTDCRASSKRECYAAHVMNCTRSSDYDTPFGCGAVSKVKRADVVRIKLV